MKNKQDDKKLKIGACYIRESTEEQDKGFSPENQKRTIEKYANDKNIKIVDYYKDLVSGTNALKRDDFQRMINDAMSNKFEVILIFHTSRFARNVEESRHYKNLLRKTLNIDVISVTQNFGDYNNPASFLNEGVHELFDEHYSLQLGFWTKAGLVEKRRQGYQLGNPPIGYYKKILGYDKERGRTIYSKEWLVNEEEAKIINEMYEMYATGRYSYADIAVELNKRGLITKYGNPFTYSSIKDMLSNKTYLGYKYSPKGRFPLEKGNHPPILSQELFDKVQEMIKKRCHSCGRPTEQHRFYLLQGLIFCYNCIKYIEGKEDNPSAKLLPKMYCLTSSSKNRTILQYGCKFRKETKSCNQETIDVSIIDNQVLKFMEGLTLPNDIIDIALLNLKKQLECVKKSAGTLQTIKNLERKKQKITFSYENTEQYTENEFMEKMREVNQEIKKYESLGISDSDKKQKLKTPECLRETERFLKDFKTFWNKDKMDNEEMRNFIVDSIKRVWVEGEKVEAIEPQDNYKPFFFYYKKLLGQSPLVTLSARSSGDRATAF